MLTSSRGLPGDGRKRCFFGLPIWSKAKGPLSSDDPRIAQDIMEADGMCET